MPKTAKIIAVTSSRSGSGNTTVCQNLGAGLAHMGKKILLVDFASNVDLTRAYGIDNTTVSYSLMDCRQGKASIQDSMLKINENIYLIGNKYFTHGHISDEYASRRGSSPFSRIEPVISDVLKPVAMNYDFIIIDCLSMNYDLVENFFWEEALSASHEVIITIYADNRFTKRLPTLLGRIEDVRRQMNPDLKLTGMVVARHNAEYKLYNDILDEVRSRFTDQLFSTVICEDDSLLEASFKRMDIFQYDETSKGATDFMALCTELLERLGG